jgi:hypothetical protein
MESSGSAFDNGSHTTKGWGIMVTFWGILVVLGVLAVARYGADSRSDADPTGRDPAWPATPTRAHTPREDVTWLGRLIAHHIRAWELHDRAMRPWEAPAAGSAPLTRRC